MQYIENPKTKGSGLLACIPQSGRCPNECPECFFQHGRSYLEPLEKNLPNMPAIELALTRVVRVNDGNDSSVDFKHVCTSTECYPFRFFNTSSAKLLAEFPGPVVLTINPQPITDWAYTRLANPPLNLMYVRILVNTWNLPLVHSSAAWYSGKNIPCVLTFMAYHGIDSIPLHHQSNYDCRKRTKNSYWDIKVSSWMPIVARFAKDPLIHSCGKPGISTLCKHCGNCLREYFATMERLHGRT